MRTISIENEAKKLANELVNIFGINKELSLNDALVKYNDIFHYNYKYISIYNNVEIINFLSKWQEKLIDIYKNNLLPELFSNDFILFLLIKNMYKNITLKNIIH